MMLSEELKVVPNHMLMAEMKRRFQTMSFVGRENSARPTFYCWQGDCLDATLDLLKTCSDYMEGDGSGSGDEDRKVIF